MTPTAFLTILKGINLLMNKIQFANNRGFFIRTEYRNTVQTVNHIRIKPLININKGNTQGIEFNILGFDFLLSTCPIDVTGGVFRPRFIIFSSYTGTKVIYLYWTNPGPQKIVNIVQA